MVLRREAPATTHVGRRASVAKTVNGETRVEGRVVEYVSSDRIDR